MNGVLTKIITVIMALFFLLSTAFFLLSCNTNADGKSDTVDSGGPTDAASEDATSGAGEPISPREPVGEPLEEMCLRYFEGTHEYYPIALSKSERCFFFPANADTSALALYLSIPEGALASCNRKKSGKGYHTFDVEATPELSMRFSDGRGNITTVVYTFMQVSSASIYISVDDKLGGIDDVNADASHNTYCNGDLFFFGRRRIPLF